MRYVAYYRVSTARQGRSGLGLEAQRKAISQFINGGGATLLSEFTEVETGKRNDRPELARAIHKAKVTGARLVIAKLDRLSRNAAFLLTLRDSGVEFVAADMPEANTLTVGIMALMAQHEREMISRRTKEALATAKARGTKLSNPNGATHLRGRGNAEAVRGARRAADDRAKGVLVEIEDIRREQPGASLRDIAKMLNQRGVQTARGGAWYAQSVRRVMARGPA